jgi:hypothetical protein
LGSLAPRTTRSTPRFPAVRLSFPSAARSLAALMKSGALRMLCVFVSRPSRIDGPGSDNPRPSQAPAFPELTAWSRQLTASVIFVCERLSEDDNTHPPLLETAARGFGAKHDQACPQPAGNSSTSRAEDRRDCSLPTRRGGTQQRGDRLDASRERARSAPRARQKDSPEATRQTNRRRRQSVAAAGGTARGEANRMAAFDPRPTLGGRNEAFREQAALLSSESPTAWRAAAGCRMKPLALRRS